MKRQQIIETIRAQVAQSQRGTSVQGIASEETTRLMQALQLPKTCLSCGAKQNHCGALPCGH